MITVRLQGGLGNQLFQIATGYALSVENNDEFLLDPNNHLLPLQGNHNTTYLDNIFRNIKTQKNLNPQNIYREPKFQYSKIPYNNNMMLIGYFQSEKYFVKYRNEILNLLLIDEKTDIYIRDRYGSLLDQKTTSIHVRRGDYLKLGNVHPVCDIRYYVEATKHFKDSENFLVFSDDIEWCRQNFYDKKFNIIDENDIISLYLMSMCDNNIIANSSFSWWGSWLNKNEEKKVIAPEKWFGNGADTKDLYCDGWQIL